MPEQKMTFDDIPSNIKRMYELREEDGKIAIGSPSYISIDDAVIESSDSSITINIKNEFVVVSLWKTSKIMTTTVFYDKDVVSFVRKWKAKRYRRKLQRMVLEDRKKRVDDEPKEELIVPEPPGLQELFG